MYNRQNTAAAYTRIIPLTLALLLLICNNIRPEKSLIKIILYDIFLASLPVMMFAKYLIHYETGSEMINAVGIIMAISLTAYEIRANFFYSFLIFFVPPVIFTIILFTYFPLDSKDINLIINIFIISTVSFIINRIQTNSGFEKFETNHLREIEKYKLKEALSELQKYKDRLEDMVEKKTVTLKLALQKAKESDALKTSFFHNISHELRTPLNAVIGFADILARRNPEMKPITDKIDQSLTSLLQTVENIVLLSELESEQTELTGSLFSVKEFNKEVINLSNNLLKANDKQQIKLIFNDNCSEDLYFRSDKDKMKIIFRQLIDNSIKYTEKGTVKIECKQISETSIQYIISDTGIGIPENELPHIFDAFRKYESEQILFKGSGTGLSICKHLMKLMNGKIMIESEQNKGTSVKLIFNGIKKKEIN